MLHWLNYDKKCHVLVIDLINMMSNWHYFDFLFFLGMIRSNMTSNDIKLTLFFCSPWDLFTYECHYSWSFQGRFSSEAYEPLSNLQILNLSNNVLHWLHQSLFEHTVDLRVLNLAGNPFGVFDYRTSIAISSLSYLEELDISNCQLKELPSLQFHNAK